MTVQVERAHSRDLVLFERMEQAPDTRDFIMPYSLNAHIESFASTDVVYLRVLSNGELAGFFILALDPDGLSVEFRRIVVASKDKGIGQMAIVEMEEFCRRDLNRKRIWLDVFEHNTRGRHIYEKLKYQRFSSRLIGDRNLLLYEKWL